MLPRSSAYCLANQRSMGGLQAEKRNRNRKGRNFGVRETRAQTAALTFIAGQLCKLTRLGLNFHPTKLEA